MNEVIRDFENPKNPILHDELIMFIMEHIKSMPSPSKSKLDIFEDLTPSKDEDSNFIVSNDEGWDTDDNFKTMVEIKWGKLSSSRSLKRHKNKKASPISFESEEQSHHHSSPLGDSIKGSRDRGSRSPFRQQLNVQSPYLNLYKFTHDDVLGLARDATMEYFKLNKWYFHETK